MPSFKQPFPFQGDTLNADDLKPIEYAEPEKQREPDPDPAKSLQARYTEREPSENLEYEENEDGETCTVTGIGDCEDTELIIPKAIDGYTVTGIGDYAFADCSELSHVVIPDCVTHIGDRAFESCTGLSKIFIPAGVESIGEKAFADGIAQIEVSLRNPNYLSIDGNLYSGDGKTLIQYAAGKKDSFFAIPDGVSLIGNYAFFGSALSDVEIPESVTAIGEGAFLSCSRLTSLVIPDSVGEIGRSAFADCKGLVTIVLPYCLKRIDERAFEGCICLKSFSIPGGVTSIGMRAFASCRSLASVIVPESVTRIEKFAFFGTDRLTKLRYTGAAAQWQEIDLHEDWAGFSEISAILSASGEIKL